MTMTRSYDPRSFGRGVAGELERLKGQVDLSWPKEARCLAGLAEGDVSRIAELGSGPGFYTSRLLELFPRAAVACVDADSLLLAEARKNLAAVSTRVQFVEAVAEHAFGRCVRSCRGPASLSASGGSRSGRAGDVSDSPAGRLGGGH